MPKFTIKLPFSVILFSQITLPLHSKTNSNTKLKQL